MSELSWQTQTMAELYAKQGHPEKALEIYRKLAQDHPHDDTIQHRLKELEGAPMGFREHLDSLIDSVPGAKAALLMGFDGIAIDSVNRGELPFDVSQLLVEYTNATQQLRNAAQTVNGAGVLTDMVTKRDGSSCLIRPLTEDYYLAMVLDGSGISGQARFKMRVVAPLLAAEL